MQKPKVFIGIPVYGQTISAQFMCSMLRLQTHSAGDIAQIETIGDSLVSRARNNLAASFLKSDCTHLLFLDADLSFGPALLERLLSHDLPLICGWYPKKSMKAEPVLNRLPGEAPDENGLWKVREAGTGIMLIRRDVFERMIEAFPGIKYNPDQGETDLRNEIGQIVGKVARDGEDRWDFFSVGIRDGRYLSEDWYFCGRWRELGGDVFVDTKCGAKHLGLIEYPISQEASK